MGKLSGFCRTVFFAVLLNIDASKGDQSECTNAAEAGGIPYIRMCEDGRVTSDRVILDTHLAASTRETNCSCRAETNVSLVFYLHYYNYRPHLNPNTPGCGSKIVITSPSTNSPFECNTPSSSPFVASPMALTWIKTSVGDSKYCIDTATDPLSESKGFTLVCSKPGATSATSSTRQSTTTAAETTFQKTNSTKTSTTTSGVTTPAMTTESSTDHGTSRQAEDTKTSTRPQRPKDSVPLNIVIPAAVGGFVLIIITVIIALICSKKNNQLSKRKDSYIDDTVELNGTTTRSRTNGNVDNDDEEGDGMKKNILYESYDQEASHSHHLSVQHHHPTFPDNHYDEI